MFTLVLTQGWLCTFRLSTVYGKITVNQTIQTHVDKQPQGKRALTDPEKFCLHNNFFYLYIDFHFYEFAFPILLIYLLL